MMGFSQLGVVVGPLLGGVFTSYTTWRWCFFINLPVGAVVAVGLFFVEIPDQFQKPSPWTVLRRLPIELDLIGFALIAPAAVQLLLALQWGGNKFAWDSPTIIGLFCGAGGTSVAWVLWDWYRGDGALIPLSIIWIRAVRAGAVTQCFLLTTIYCASFFLPIFFQADHGATPMMSGIYVLASILPQLLTAVMAGVLGKSFCLSLLQKDVFLTTVVVERTGYVIPYAMLSGTIGAISNGLYSTFSATTPTSQWVGYQVLNGVGRGFGMQMVCNIVTAPYSRTILIVAAACSCRSSRPQARRYLHGHVSRRLHSEPRHRDNSRRI
jgi:MFS family permease